MDVAGENDTRGYGSVPFGVGDKTAPPKDPLRIGGYLNLPRVPVLMR